MRGSRTRFTASLDLALVSLAGNWCHSYFLSHPERENPQCDASAKQEKIVYSSFHHEPSKSPREHQHSLRSSVRDPALPREKIGFPIEHPVETHRSQHRRKHINNSSVLGSIFLDPFPRKAKTCLQKPRRRGAERVKHKHRLPTTVSNSGVPQQARLALSVLLSCSRYSTVEKSTSFLFDHSSISFTGSFLW